MNYKLFVRQYCLPLVAFFFLLISGCKEEDYASKLGTSAKASFKVTKVQGKVNTYLLESTSQDAYRYQWDFGLNEGLKSGGSSIEAYFISKGTYNVKLYAYGQGGYDIATQPVVVEQDDFTPTLNDETYKLLTAHTWKLDASSTAPIIVGTENNPGEYYPGGALSPCQVDDDYTFSFANNAFKLTYRANGQTLHGGNCGSDRSYESTFTFSKTVEGAGIATITIPGSAPDRFIGITDPSSNNYRIISITANEMVLRSGKSSEVVHQMRFVKK
ncbi:lipocalin family protein [Pedobacter ureilyticus]|uniref:Lipocalin family protein n=1 Tax=Pedobacter ureilyticus TaxID=1393051 RepID=A0ABW9J3I6_9SPHI|nr:lipocalin family protein [Pedobacter helvus]